MNPFRKTVSPNTSPKTRGIKVSAVRARFERWQHTVIQYRSERTGGRKRWERYFNKGEQNKSKEEEAAVPPRTSRKELKERGGNSGGNSSPSRCLVVPKRREGRERIRRRSRVGNMGRMRRMPAAKRSVTRLEERTGRRVCPRTIYPPPPLPLTCTYTCIQGRISDTSTRRHLSGPLLFPRQRRINRLFYSSNVKSILHRVVRQDGGGGVHKERRREREREGRRSENAGDGRSKPIVYLRLRLCDPTPTHVSPSSYLTWRNVG